jgi:hypothetical protein
MCRLPGFSDTLSLFRPSKEEVHVRQFSTRTAVWGLSVTLAFGAVAVPCAAEETGTTAKAPSSLARLSPAGLQLLLDRAPGPVARAQDQPGSTSSSPGAFFHSKRGAITMVLMTAGTVFTVWSINHDRKPVKSPVR